MNAPFSLRVAARDPFSAFMTDAASEDVVRVVAGDLGWPHERIHEGGLRSAIQSLAVMPSPAILFVDLSETPDPLEEINGLAEVCEPGTIVLATGTVNDVRFYRDLLGAGIQDYLIKPFTADQLARAISDAQAATAAPKGDAGAERPHMTVAVVGVRGGVGASTVAVSTAWMLGDRRQRSATLLDLDVHFGTGALALDLEPGRGLTDAIENPGRIDGLFIERALVRHNERLAVLSAEASISQPVGLDGTAFLQLQDELKAAGDCTIVDLPRHMLIQHPALLAAAGAVIIVTELTLAGARDTIRLLSWLKANAPNAQPIVVANKLPATGQPELARKDFEGSIERAVDVVLPIDAKLAHQAAQTGKPIAELAKAAKLGQGFAELADKLVALDGEAAAPTTIGNRSLLGQLRALLPQKKS